MGLIVLCAHSPYAQDSSVGTQMKKGRHDFS